MVAQKVGYFMETEEKKIYTIEDIARELGVSKTTVSRAISGKGRISQATRDRVRAFIKEHDYRPNVVAKGLAQRKTYNIALLLHQISVQVRNHLHHLLMLQVCVLSG